MCNLCISHPKCMNFSSLERWDQEEQVWCWTLFSFGAWNLEIFEVEVWKNLTYHKFPKCQAICLNIPSCLTFNRSFKWETCMHQSCIYLKYLQNGHQFHVIWIWNDRVMHFWSLEKSLDQWYRSKWPIM